MSVALPDQIDPWRAVKLGLSFQGSLPLTELPRLAAVVLADGSGGPTQIQYDLSFGRDDKGRALLSGRVRSRLPLPCQRCLREVSLQVDAEVMLIMVKTEEGASTLDSDVEPLIVGDAPLRPRDLIEDELLLAIPVVPRHAFGQCQAPAGQQDAVERDGAASASERPNPFAVLATLKDRRRD